MFEIEDFASRRILISHGVYIVQYLSRARSGGDNSRKPAAVAEFVASRYNALSKVREWDIIGNTLPENMVAAEKRLRGAQ